MIGWKLWLAGVVGIVAVVFGAFTAGRMVAGNACDARIEAIRATTTQDILSQIQEGSNAAVEKAIDARRSAERDFDSGRLPDGDPYLRPDQ